MALLDRDVYLRNYIMGVLVFHSEKGLNYGNMGALADSLTEAMIQADDKWREESLCEQFRAVTHDLVFEDVKQ